MVFRMRTSRLCARNRHVARGMPSGQRRKEGPTVSGDQRTTTKWMIRVDGSDLTSIEAGQTVEIGRKPLRPVPDDGMRRIEILDDTRSMSKRHAEFSVKSDGNAILRDLNSTNGTFLVRPGNELVRLPGGSDFAMTDDTVRLQFGDVPVDFVRYIDDDTTNDDDDVANLFDYALDNQPSEPEAADMSIDDILNLRAGEPTNIFNAGQVRSRAKELRQAEQQTFVPFTSPLNPLAASETSDEEDDDAAPRDLFADAHDVAAGKIEEPAAKKQEFVPRTHDGPRHADRRNADSLVSVTELAQQHRPIPSLDIAQPLEPTVGATRTPVSPTVSPTSYTGEPSITTTIRPERNADASSDGQGARTLPVQPAIPTRTAEQSAQTPSQQPHPAQLQTPQSVQSQATQPQTAPSDVPLVHVDIPSVGAASEIETAVQSVQPVQSTASDAFAEQRNALHFDVIESTLEGVDSTVEPSPNTADTDERTDFSVVTVAPVRQTSFVTDDAAYGDDARTTAQQTTGRTSAQMSEQTAAHTAEPTDDGEDYSRFQRHDDDDARALDETQAFTPAFEPGSVFERVANGDFDKPKELIEAGGYTSDDARRSDDFAEQFEMAKYAELLPFLAMNPTLYDDLYEWLAAQSNADVDEALSRNPGYEDYRKAVGK